MNNLWMICSLRYNQRNIQWIKSTSLHSTKGKMFTPLAPNLYDSLKLLIIYRLDLKPTS